MRFASCFFISIILFTILSCKKSVNENSSKYYFTTKLAHWAIFPPMNTTCCQRDTIIYYTGTVTYKSGMSSKLNTARLFLNGFLTILPLKGLFIRLLILLGILPIRTMGQPGVIISLVGQ